MNTMDTLAGDDVALLSFDGSAENVGVGGAQTMAQPPPPPTYTPCMNCKAPVQASAHFCIVCGATQQADPTRAYE